ncbi:hypothetical protein EDD16DRAFT_493888 [Pisolithus croceorrhizus]|nr:hypothetical protein EDD16DRAFT_493888 [Pisolithus croceorrhizus]KAI6142532.1 hypothetical protein EDD17DRAFT_237214 [Pisolithus thermaeus]
MHSTTLPHHKDIGTYGKDGGTKGRLTPLAASQVTAIKTRRTNNIVIALPLSSLRNLKGKTKITRRGLSLTRYAQRGFDVSNFEGTLFMNTVSLSALEERQPECGLYMCRVGDLLEAHMPHMW